MKGQTGRSEALVQLTALRRVRDFGLPRIASLRSV